MRRPATLAALVIAAAIALSPSVLADPTADPGDVQTLTPPPSLALDEQFLADLTNAGMRIADVPVAIAGAHDTCAFIAARHTCELVECRTPALPIEPGLGVLTDTRQIGLIALDELD
jgi:hypothetical protein